MAAGTRASNHTHFTIAAERTNLTPQTRPPGGSTRRSGTLPDGTRRKRGYTRTTYAVQLQAAHRTHSCTRVHLALISSRTHTYPRIAHHPICTGGSLSRARAHTHAARAEIAWHRHPDASRSCTQSLPPCAPALRSRSALEPELTRALEAGAHAA